MATVTRVLPDFPGFGACYDPSQKPFFEANVVADLRTIASKPIGKTLLDAIAKASPRNRTPASNIAHLKDIAFPDSVNVMCVPTTMEFYESGFKAVGSYNQSGKFVKDGLTASAQKAHNPTGCRFYGSGGSYAEAADPSFGSRNGGTVSVMHYTNAQTFSQGAGVREITYPHIVLAHELIHCLHHLQGSTLETTTGGSRDEELRTTGIGAYVDEALSENKFRAAFGLGLRVAY